MTATALKLSGVFHPTGEEQRIVGRWRFAVVAFYGSILAGLILFAVASSPRHVATDVPAMQIPEGRIKPSAHAAELVRDSAAHAGIPSRLNVFEFGFTDSNAIPK